MLSTAKPGPLTATGKAQRKYVRGKDLHWEVIDESPPEKEREGSPFNRMLDSMAVGHAVRVNRKESSAYAAVKAYRKLPENQSKKFILRAEAANKWQTVLWTKIWRVA